MRCTNLENPAPCLFTPAAPLLLLAARCAAPPFGRAAASWRVSLPPKWVDVVDRCEEHMDGLDKNCEALVALHTKRLMVR